MLHLIAAAAGGTVDVPHPLWMYLVSVFVVAAAVGCLVLLIAVGSSRRFTIGVPAAVFAAFAVGGVIYTMSEHAADVAAYETRPAAAAAGNVNTPGDALRRLAEHHHRDVRAAVGGNSDAPADALDVLSVDPSADVRAAVAANPSTAADVLAAMAHDREPAVRARAAANSSADADALLLLAADPDLGVRAAALANPAVDERMLLAAANGDLP